mmetsp:Transcript_33383/g.87911  ORF Transcript_33383/g.87911 Transcript_33383/m.87911 type:complete len:214 (-) Transcript_33383:137-778(-)
MSGHHAIFTTSEPTGTSGSAPWSAAAAEPSASPPATPVRPASRSSSRMDATSSVRHAGFTPALCAASRPSASMYDLTTMTPDACSASAVTSSAQMFSSTATTSVRLASSAMAAGPPQAPAGTTIASTSSLQMSPGSARSEPSSSDGARARLAKMHGRKVWPSSSAHARGESSGSRSSGPKAGACAQGRPSSLVTRCEMIASTPPTASTPLPAR